MLIDKRIHWIDIKQLHLYKHYIKSLFSGLKLQATFIWYYHQKAKRKEKKKSSFFLPELHPR